VLEHGTRVAGYEIEGVLGSGATAVVYEARQLALDRKVALKVLTLEPGMDPSFRARFAKEGRVQAGLDHPSVVAVFEAGEWEGAPFIAMQLVRGDTLSEMILAQALAGDRALRLLRPIADALDTAHAAGVIHRDVKPQNILVAAGDRPYLADFGLTKRLEDTALTRAGQFVGTLDYVAPEQIIGQAPTGACDVYALGAVLFECLTGAAPYRGHADAAVLYAHLSEPPPLVSELRPDLPRALDAVIAAAMAKDPAARPGTATELIERAEAAYAAGWPAVSSSA
jgi:serine/threonine-protein kinase